MEVVEPQDFVEMIKETLEYLKSSVKAASELNNLNRVDIELFADQLKEESNQGTIITKKYIYLCFMETIKRKIQD